MALIVGPVAVVELFLLGGEGGGGGGFCVLGLVLVVHRFGRVVRLAGDSGVGQRLRDLAAVGLLEVDDLAQQDAPAGELLAPDHDRLEGQRALAQAADHGVAAGLDALGDGDFALARKQLDRAHLAQVHAHRVVGAVEGALLVGALGDRRLLADDDFAGLGRVLLGLDDIDAHFGEHGQGVLDGLAGHFLRRQDLVQLVHGDVATGLGLLDEFLDPGVGKVEQRAVGRRRALRRLSSSRGLAHLGLRPRREAPWQEGRRETWGWFARAKGARDRLPSARRPASQPIAKFNSIRSMSKSSLS